MLQDLFTICGYQPENIVKGFLVPEFESTEEQLACENGDNRHSNFSGNAPALL